MGIPEAAPARLGRYELVARLATGGMGEIFLARLEGAAGFEKLFVIKRILPHLADDARFRGMLIAEARIASVMSHANICQVYELGETDGQLYIVMEYLEGITLLPLLHRHSKDATPLALGFVVGVIQQAIDGLHYAHELKDRGGEYLGIVHRDVTPSNIFLTDAGIAKILDFGIAKVKDASAHTQTGTVKGKYAYMAPEQLRGGAIDRRADVFALGIVLYEMLALRRLFQRKTDYLTFRAAMEQPIPDVRHYRPDCPALLSAALTRALERDPASRFATARQFGSAVLDAITQGQRPWSQSEIGDFVAANFAADIQKRGAQIASAVRSGGPPMAMPVIVQPDEDTEISTDNEFPPVDSVVSDRPVLRPASSGASPGLAALRGVPASASQQQPIVAVHPRRGVFWPMVAVAMVAVTACALFLVWRQTQHQQRQPIVITQGSNIRVVEGGSDTAVEPISISDPEPVLGTDETRGEVPVAPDKSKGSAQRKIPGRVAASSKAASDRYKQALLAHKSEMDRCTSTYGNVPPGTGLVIIIDPAGRAERISLDPEAVGASPVGRCIKDVLKPVVFPSSDGNYRLDVKLTK